MKYKHVFFDLDRTLWDFETNSALVLAELIHHYGLDKKGVGSVNDFISEYHKINHALWEDFRHGLVDKPTLRTTRFERALALYGIIDKELCQRISEEYVKESPRRTALLPFTKEALGHLAKRYQLHIITNGFEETQHVKLRSAGLSDYFKEVITSERAGFRKPDIRMFEFSLQAAAARREESIMIGDHFELDVMGAKNAGMDQCFFNPAAEACRERPTYEIRSLRELIELL